MPDLTVLQVNIRNWYSNKYIFETDLANYPPDVILLNETSAVDNKIKLQGYYVSQICNEQFSGVAILVKNHLQFSLLHAKDNNTLAIKLITTLGPIIIATAYVPPRQNFINTITLNKILDHNLPTLFIADFNAHHHIFNNITRAGHCDTRGRQLASLAQARNLEFMGPLFHTYQQGNRKGTPDIALCNRQFRMFHYHITKGNYIKSDHFPIILKVSTLPIKIVIPNKINQKSLNVNEFKNTLSNDHFPDLNHQPVTLLDEVVNTIFDNINSALALHCPTITIKPISNYQPTPQIQLKLKQVQVAFNSYLTNGFPSLNIIHSYQNELLNLITAHKKSNWESVVKIASDCYGQPGKFWNKIKNSMGNDRSPPECLIRQFVEESDSEDEMFGVEQVQEITDPQEKVLFMRSTWKEIFKPNAIYNANTRQVQRWFESNLDNFHHDNLINLDSLTDDHPLLRPVTDAELQYAIKDTEDKAPGFSGIKINTFRNLPPNYFAIIISLFSSIIASKYWPLKFKSSKMIFAPKAGKSKSNPQNYRPISLLEILAKLFEKIIMYRLLLYLEFNNILPQCQFGFRPGRSTQHSIQLARQCIKESQAQQKTVLVAKRDIKKAFDTVWLQGLLYKINVKLQLDLHFTAFIYNYVFNRSATPTFEGKMAQPFTPLSGVPQGSALGPILFLIFVYDIPNPLFNDSMIFQFADDIIHVIRSDSTRNPNRALSAKRKLQQELKRTLDWEVNWKIQTCYDKCLVGFSGSTLDTLEAIGGIRVNNHHIRIVNEISILGFTFNNLQRSTPQVISAISKAKVNIAKLYRFRSAPVKIKRYLYITLIRPLLEYPCLELCKTSKENIIKLQRIQNSATRFILNVKLNDRIRSEELHARAKLDPINIRLAKLSRKMLYKMRDLYVTANQDIELAPYVRLAIDYEITEEPRRPLQPNHYMRMQDNIFYPGYNRRPFLENLPEDREDYPIPAAIFS